MEKTVFTRRLPFPGPEFEPGCNAVATASANESEVP